MDNDDREKFDDPLLKNTNFVNPITNLNGRLKDVDPDEFLNSELPECITDTPIYSEPYTKINDFCKNKQSLSIISFNIRSLSRHIDEFKILLSSLPAKFSIICLQETWARDENENFDSRFEINGYNCYHVHRSDEKRGGGLCIYTDNNLDIKERPDLNVSELDIEAQFLEVVMLKSKNILIGNVYRPPRGKVGVFNKKLSKFMKVEAKQKLLYFCGDMNLNMFNHETDPKVRAYLNKIKESFFMPAITKATRVTMRTSTCIDNIFFNVNFNEKISSGIIQVRISDHFPIFLIIEGALANNIILNNNNKTQVVKHIINDKNIKHFEEKIKTYNWQPILNSNDVNEGYIL